jgi:WD40 repeat protein
VRVCVTRGLWHCCGRTYVSTRYEFNCPTHTNRLFETATNDLTHTYTQTYSTNTTQTRMSSNLNYRQVGQFNGHTGWVLALAVLPHGKLASGSMDKTIYIWDIATQRCEATLRGHDNLVLSLRALHSGKLASGSADNKIRIWDVSSQQCEVVLEGHKGGVSALVQLPNNKLASGCWDKTIRIWDLDTQQCETVLSGHEMTVNSVAVLPHDKLASGSNDKTIRIWDMNSKQCATVLRGHEGKVTSLCALSNNRVASCSTDRTVRVWNLLTQNCELVLRGHEGSVNAVMGLPNNRLASCSADRTVRVWNLATGLCEGVIKENDRSVECLTAISIDTIANGSFDSTIRLFQYECYNDKVALSEVLASPLLSTYSLRASVVAAGRSYRKWAVNLWYKVDGTARWVHHLREHYKQRSKLRHVLRVDSAQKDVDFGQYFVNLALVRHVDHLTREYGLLRDKEGTLLSLDRGELYDRLFTEKRFCAVEDIFGNLADRSQPAGWIRIVGRAGTGKTTLTHYLAYRWGQKDCFWDNRFDAVFRVKLNLLAQEAFIVPSPAMESYLATLIFGSLDKSKLLDMATIVYFLRKRSMVTLLLLDGFDEIASLYNKNHNVKCVMDYALSLPNGILTSRPVDFPVDWAIKECFKQTYENIGLSEENVRSYVDHYFTRGRTAVAQSLCEMLDRNPTMMKLAQIPVNLNAMCSIWQRHDGASTDQGSMTVTGLYDRMVLSVLRHHKLKLTVATTRHEYELRDDSLRNGNYNELRVLAALAFTAFECGQTQTVGIDVMKMVLGVDLQLLSLFREHWGLLRQAEAVIESSSASSSDTFGDHYFVHLTYQEYFVALHFAEALIPSETSKAAAHPEPKTTHVKRMSYLKELQRLACKIRDNRHNARYAVIWTFLSGLLSRRPYADYADYYWDALLPESEDVGIGSTGSSINTSSADRSGRLGVHPSSAILSAFGSSIREAIFGSRETGVVLPKRLEGLAERLKRVLQWQLLCEDRVSLGDKMSNSRQELESRRRQHENRKRQLLHDLQTLEGKALTVNPWGCLMGFWSHYYNFDSKPGAVSVAGCLSSEQTSVRADAIRELCLRPEVGCVDKLGQLVLSDPEEAIRAMAQIAWCLQIEADSSDPHETDVSAQIESGLKDPSSDMRRSAVMLLGARVLESPISQQTAVALRLRSILQTREESICVRVLCAKLLVMMDNDREAHKFVVESLRMDDTDVRLEALSFLKEKTGLFQEAALVRQLLETLQFVTVEEDDVAVILRRIRPEVYEQMDTELLSKGPIAKGYVESLWLHLGSSGCRVTPALCSAEADLLAALSAYPEVGEVIRALQQPLSLPLVTDIFDESFVTNNLSGKPVSDDSFQSGADGGTSVANLQHCCLAIDDYITLESALFGLDYSLTLGMTVAGVTIQAVREAVDKCSAFILSDERFSTGALGGLDKDMLLAIRVYTVVEPPIYKLLNFPFYNPNNRIPGSLLNQLPYMKCLLRSYDTIFSSAPQLVYAGPSFRGMNTEGNPYLTKKYTNWQDEYATGKRLTFPSFTSVSLDMTKAEQYSKRDDGKGASIIYKFPEVVGLRLGILSTEIEQEVLLKPPAVFIIRNATISNEAVLSVTLEMDATSTLTYL